MSEWKYIVPDRPVCDLCQRLADWRHPLGGLRCSKCPRPEAESPSEQTSQSESEDK